MPGNSISEMLEIQSIKLLRDLDDLTGLLEVMVFFAKFGRANISNFIKDLRLNQQPVYRTLKRLIELDLVTVKKEVQSSGRGRRTKYYYLTDRGKRIAPFFAKMYDAYREFSD